MLKDFKLFTLKVYQILICNRWKSMETSPFPKIFNKKEEKRVKKINIKYSGFVLYTN